MKYIILLLILAISYGCGCTNPSVAAGEVGYVTNEPFMFGEKGEFLGIIVGPSSYGIGWRDDIKYSTSYKPTTIKEYFSPINGAGEGKKTDTRIMSSDEINMEVSVSAVLYIRNSPATPDKDLDKFKVNAKIYFQDYNNFWKDRYREPFRTKIRDMLGKESYKTAKAKRTQLSKEASDWLTTQFENTPIGVLSVNISNINPPQRMLAEQELMKATEIAENRQAKEQKLQESRKAVLDQEAENLASALKIAPRLLEWRDLTIKQTYAEAFNNLVTGEEAKAIKKIVFMPYGTPVAAPADVDTQVTVRAPKK